MQTQCRQSNNVYNIIFLELSHGEAALQKEPAPPSAPSSSSSFNFGSGSEGKCWGKINASSLCASHETKSGISLCRIAKGLVYDRAYYCSILHYSFSILHKEIIKFRLVDLTSKIRQRMYCDCCHSRSVKDDLVYTYVASAVLCTH